MRICALQVLRRSGLAFVAADIAATTEGKAAFVFGGVGYFHRWSENDQHEFAPTG